MHPKSACPNEVDSQGELLMGCSVEIVGDF